MGSVLNKNSIHQYMGVGWTTASKIPSFSTMHKMVAFVEILEEFAPEFRFYEDSKTKAEITLLFLRIKLICQP